MSECAIIIFGVIILSDSILVALISAISGIVAYLFSSLFGPDGPFQTTRNAKILEKQLFNVFEPLSKMYESDDRFQTETVSKVLTETIENNYSLVPPSIIKLYRRRSSFLKNDLGTADIDLDLQRMAISNWNWAKKKLGYPYIQSDIFQEDIDCYQRLNQRKTFVSDAISFILTFLFPCACYLVFGVYPHLPSEPVWRQALIQIFWAMECTFVGYQIFKIGSNLSNRIQMNKKRKQLKNQKAQKEAAEQNNHASS